MHWAEHSTHTWPSHLILMKNLYTRYHFIDEETDAQKEGKWHAQGPHQLLIKLELKLRCAWHQGMYSYHLTSLSMFHPTQVFLIWAGISPPPGILPWSWHTQDILLLFHVCFFLSEQWV